MLLYLDVFVRTRLQEEFKTLYFPFLFNLTNVFSHVLNNNYYHHVECQDSFEQIIPNRNDSKVWKIHKSYIHSFSFLKFIYQKITKKNIHIKNIQK